MVCLSFSGILSPYRRAIFDLESRSCPEFINYNATETLASTDAKALLIYSKDDPICSKKHYEKLVAALGERENISFLLEDGKGHNPNYSTDAAKYLAEFGKARAKLARRKGLSEEECRAFVESYDWERMTVQDEAVWQRIFEHLDN